MKCDFHCHTHYSYDSNASVEEVVNAAIQKGIDCLAITDHHEVKGALEAREYAGERLLIIPGIEITTKQGDILGLGVEQIIPKGLSPEETIKMILEAGGFPIIAHPFTWPFHFRKVEEFVQKNGIVGIEILNGASPPFFNRKAKKLAEKYNLPFTAGSDAHSPKYVGNVYLEIPEKREVREVISAIKKKEGKIGGKELNILQKAVVSLEQGREIVKSWMNR